MLNLAESETRKIWKLRLQLSFISFRAPEGNYWKPAESWRRQKPWLANPSRGWGLSVSPLDPGRIGSGEKWYQLRSKRVQLSMRLKIQVRKNENYCLTFKKFILQLVCCCGLLKLCFVVAEYFSLLILRNHDQLKS